MEFKRKGKNFNLELVKCTKEHFDYYKTCEGWKRYTDDIEEYDDLLIPIEININGKDIKLESYNYSIMVDNNPSGLLCIDEVYNTKNIKDYIASVFLTDKVRGYGLHSLLLNLAGLILDADNIYGIIKHTNIASITSVQGFSICSLKEFENLYLENTYDMYTKDEIKKHFIIKRNFK